MDNEGRGFHFRIVPQESFKMTVTNQVNGAFANLSLPRQFTIRLTDSDGVPLPAGRTFGLHLGEYVQESQSTQPHDLIPILTTVTVGEDGVLAAGLPALMPGESFSLYGLGGMYRAQVYMSEFANHERYDVSNFYIRNFDSEPSVPIVRLYSDATAIERGHLEFVFTSYNGSNNAVLTGLWMQSIPLVLVVLVLTMASATTLALPRRIRFKDVPRQ
jgi:hypothetical protein